MILSKTLNPDCLRPGGESEHRDQQGLHVEPQLRPEPLPHQAVDVEVEAGVEDNEDIVEVSNTEPESWDRIFSSTGAV